MKVAELQQELRRRGLSTQGLKPELEQRLAEARLVPSTMDEFEARIAQCEAKRKALRKEMDARDETLREEMNTLVALKKGAEEDFRSAAEQGNVPECARFLDEVHVNIRAHSHNYETALSLAILSGQLEMVSFLHSRGAFEHVSYHLTFSASSRAMLELLESFGLQPNSDTLRMAIQSKKNAVVDYLVCEVKVSLEHALGFAVTNLGEPDLDVMRLLLKHHANLDPAYPSWSPLQYECTKPSPSTAVMTLLLEHGAKLYGNQILFSLRGKPEATRVLLDWRQARRLWVLRSAHECKRIASRSALHQLPKDLTRMVGCMLGEEESRWWVSPDEQDFDDDEDDEDGGY
jgi:hypothetical protein